MSTILSLIVTPVATFLVSAFVNWIRPAAIGNKLMLLIVALFSAGMTAVDTLWLGSTTNVVSLFLAGLVSTFIHQVIKNISPDSTPSVK